MDFFELLGNLIFFFLILGGLSKILKRRFQTQNSSQHRNAGQTSHTQSHTQEPKTQTEYITLSDSELLSASESQSEHQQPLSLSSVPDKPRVRKQQRQRRASSAQKRRSASLLAFDRRRGYLQGIVLSEILGPPVSKRH